MRTGRLVLTQNKPLCVSLCIDCFFPLANVLEFKADPSCLQMYDPDLNGLSPNFLAVPVWLISYPVPVFIDNDLPHAPTYLSMCRKSHTPFFCCCVYPVDSPGVPVSAAAKEVFKGFSYVAPMLYEVCQHCLMT